jgi:hypothetical protein
LADQRPPFFPSEGEVVENEGLEVSRYFTARGSFETILARVDRTHAAKTWPHALPDLTEILDLPNDA